MFANVGLLFIEPEQPASPAPVLDPATRRMCGAFRKAIRSDYSYRGFHTCFCGARSDSYDWTLPNGQLTNSLCVHYVSHHRPDVPAEQRLWIESFAGEAHPGESELQGPGPILDRFRLTVAVRLGRKRLRTWTA